MTKRKTRKPTSWLTVTAYTIIGLTMAGQALVTISFATNASPNQKAAYHNRMKAWKIEIARREEQAARYARNAIERDRIDAEIRYKNSPAYRRLLRQRGRDRLLELMGALQ